MKTKKTTFFFLLLGFFILLPAVASASNLTLYYSPEFNCPLRVQVMNTETGEIAFETTASPDPQTQTYSLPLQLEPGSYNASIQYSYPDGTRETLFEAPLNVETGGEEFVYDIQIPDNVVESCLGGTNPDAIDQFTVCINAPDGDLFTVRIENADTGELLAEGTTPPNTCEDLVGPFSLDGIYLVSATRESTGNHQSVQIQFSEFQSSYTFTFRPPSDIVLYLSNPDFEQAQSLDVEVGDQVQIWAIDVNNPDLFPTLNRIYVNGNDQRTFGIPLQFFEQGVGWAGNRVMFLVEPRDAGQTLEISADVFVHGEDPADPANEGGTIFTPPPVYVNVAERNTGGGDIEIVRQELLDLITSIQNDFQVQLQNIRLEFSDGLDALGNLSVREGNKSSTLYDFLQKGGKALQGHFDHKVK